MITLQNIDADNFWDIVSLDVSESQHEFILSNAVSIAQSKVQPECIPLAIYNDKIPVGFAMYCIDRDDGEYWIYRLMIDEKYQSKGFGKAAMQLLLNEIQRDKRHNKIFLGVHTESINAVKLYENLGFRFNNQVFSKEHIMLLNY
jgi:diamine N-acetyltransferase